MFLSAISPRVLLSIRPRIIMGGKVGSACEEFTTVRVVYRVNVSESSGVGLSGLSQIKGCEMVFVNVIHFT